MSTTVTSKIKKKKEIVGTKLLRSQESNEFNDDGSSDLDKWRNFCRTHVTRKSASNLTLTKRNALSRFATIDETVIAFAASWTPDETIFAAAWNERRTMRQHLYGFALHRLCTRNRIRSHLTEIQGVSLKANRYIAEKIKPSKCLESNTVRSTSVFLFLSNLRGRSRKGRRFFSNFHVERVLTCNRKRMYVLMSGSWRLDNNEKINS